MGLPPEGERAGPEGLPLEGERAGPEGLPPEGEREGPEGLPPVAESADSARPPAQNTPSVTSVARTAASFKALP